jgi:hypothetical protein
MMMSEHTKIEARQLAHRQELFDETLANLRKQGGGSWSAATGDCKYRDETGRRCAIGFLIPDSEYQTAMEGKGIDALVRFLPGGELRDKLFLDVEFLGLIQACHDKAAQDARGQMGDFRPLEGKERQDMRDELFMKEFENQMEYLAVHWELNYSVQNLNKEEENA